MQSTQDGDRPVPSEFWKRVPVLIDATDRTSVVIDKAIEPVGIGRRGRPVLRILRDIVASRFKAIATAVSGAAAAVAAIAVAIVASSNWLIVGE